MASRAISGRPGAGKSLWSVMKLLEELETTERPIVTNLPLRLDKIVEYFLAKGREDIAVYDRIQLLEDEQVPFFWRYRGPGTEPLPTCSNAEMKGRHADDPTHAEYIAPKVPDYSSVKPGGVAYFIDEAHTFLNSQQWQAAGLALMYYITQHRHLGDDVWWITQAIKNVNSQFRSVTQDYTYCRNFGKEKWRGFTKGTHFTATTYLQPLTDAAVKPDFEEQTQFHMDKAVASCYWTSKQKLAADVGVRTKGMSIWWLFVGLGVLCVVVIFALWIGPKMFMEHQLAPMKKGVVKTPAKQPSENGAPLDTPDLAGNSKDGSTGKPSPTPTPPPTQILAVPLQQVVASQLLEALKDIPHPGVNVVPTATNDGILLAGTDLQQLMAYAELVRGFDKQAPAIVVNAVVGRVVRGKGLHVGLYDMLQRAASANESAQLADLLAGMTYDVVTGVGSFGTAIAARDVLAVVTDFNASGYRFEVMSRPSLTVVSGQRGEFKTGRRIPIPSTVRDAAGSQTSIQYENAEFSFIVTPTVTQNGLVRLQLEQGNSDVLSTAEVGGDAVPTLSTQTLRTILDLRPGDVGYLGGIHIRTKQRESRGVPILKDIPGVNLVFGTRSNGEEESELVLLVSVESVQPGQAPVRVRRATRPNERDQWEAALAEFHDRKSAGAAPTPAQRKGRPAK